MKRAKEDSCGAVEFVWRQVEALEVDFWCEGQVKNGHGVGGSGIAM